MYIKASFIFVFSFFIVGSLFSQRVHLEGLVQDSIGNPIFAVNMIATPLVAGEHKMTFAITDQKGAYRLALEKEVAYSVAISSIGYSTKTDTLSYSSNAIKNYVLEQSTQQLDEVILRAELAIIVKEDTTVYRADKFKTGTERKLRELLGNLPGVEVDQVGNVKVNGKEVTDLLVNGKPFFGGDTKLGVNNIPSEVVEEVVVVDNYHEVSFMKGLESSDKMSMDIKLKQGKSSFAFGEVEAGGGDSKRYYLYPSLFYYSPKTSANFIGSLNNVNRSPLNFQDLIRFQGGIDLTPDPINTGNKALQQFSYTPDALHSKTIFGALNLNHQVNEQLRIEFYSIANQQKKEGVIASEIEYVTQNQLIEERNLSQVNKNSNLINNLKLRYNPTNSLDIAYNLMASLTDATSNSAISSSFAEVLSLTNTSQDPYNFELTQDFRFSKQSSFKHTSRINTSHTYIKENRLTDWLFDKPVFSEVIPSIEEGDRYNFLNDYASSTNKGRIEFKHYWVMRPKSHLYPIAGFYFHHQNYTTTDYQLLSDGSTHDFKSAGFDNALRYQLINPYIGFQYKFQLGKFIFRPGAVLHHYFWEAKQFGEQLAKQDKAVLLPEFLLEFKPTSGETLKLEYNLVANFSGASEYANRYRLVSFNQLYRGNSDLENSLHHDLKLSYSGISRYKDYFYNFSLNYLRKEKSIQQTTLLEGIDQVSTSIYSGLPENNYTALAGIQRRSRYLSLSFNTRMVLSDFSRLINQQQYDYSTQIFGYGLQANFTKEGLPNLRVSFAQNFSNTKATSFKNNFLTSTPSIAMDYRLGRFMMKADYSFTHNKAQLSRQNDTYQQANASLYYTKAESSWAFEIRVNNLFDLTYKRQHSMNQFMLHDQWTYVQPRTALFILSYKI